MRCRSAVSRKSCKSAGAMLCSSVISTPRGSTRISGTWLSAREILIERLVELPDANLLIVTEIDATGLGSPEPALNLLNVADVLVEHLAECGSDFRRRRPGLTFGKEPHRDRMRYGFARRHARQNPRFHQRVVLVRPGTETIVDARLEATPRPPVGIDTVEDRIEELGISGVIQISTGYPGIVLSSTVREYTARRRALGHQQWRPVCIEHGPSIELDEFIEHPLLRFPSRIEE